ncbi:hypothetical protein LguiA_022852 [Lonicera macranthoides]
MPVALSQFQNGKAKSSSMTLCPSETSSIFCDNPFEEVQVPSMERQEEPVKVDCHFLGTTRCFRI